jgi:DNA repair exonuclease SbcCD nuclease subunit
MIDGRIELPTLLAADLHLTANPRDEYRWSLIDWIEAQKVTQHLKSVILLGDLTDAKDNHSAVLVNRVVNSIKRLAQTMQVVVLRGNHDYLVSDHPFFQFLSQLPNVLFLNVITAIDLGKANAIFLPHTKTPKEDWGTVMPWRTYDIGFMHQTVSGSVASNGEKLDGEISGEVTKERLKFYSGDIHVPQVVGDVEYVGSPYHVHFGDRFKPRCIVLDERLGAHDLHFPTLEKFVAQVTSVEDLQRLDIKEGDQLKVVVQIPTSMTADWFKIKKDITEYCTKRGVKLYGVELKVAARRRLLVNESAAPVKAVNMGLEAAIKTFASKEKLPQDVVNAGLEIAGVAYTPPQD